MFINYYRLLHSKMRASVSNRQLLMTGYGDVNVWVLYHKVNDLLTEPGQAARHHSETRAVTQTELEGILAKMGHEDPANRSGLISGLLDTNYLAKVGEGYRVTGQGVAVWHALNRRV